MSRDTRSPAKRGTTPLARGIQIQCCAASPSDGINPAEAGNTRPTPFRGRVVGATPRMQGIRGINHSEASKRRNNPAYAGNIDFAV